MSLLRFIFLSVACLICAGLSAQELGVEETEIYHFKGVHFLASYCECDSNALEDVDGLYDAMQRAVVECGATVLQSSHYIFPPNGMTMVVLLSESHASIHTYPEHRACFVDLFTCGDKCSAEKFDAVLQDYLKPKKIGQRILLRNEEVMDP